MELRSESFADKGRIPLQHIRKQIGGQNLSPPLAWTEPPAGTRSFALSIVDPHPVARNWVHWLVVNIPGYARKLGAGVSGHKMPPGSHELANGFGVAGYDGPQPPKGSGDHPYVFTLYALDVARVDLPDQTELPQFQAALKGHVLAQVSLTGMYGQ